MKKIKNKPIFIGHETLNGEHWYILDNEERLLVINTINLMLDTLEVYEVEGYDKYKIELNTLLNKICQEK